MSLPNKILALPKTLIFFFHLLSLFACKKKMFSKLINQTTKRNILEEVKKNTAIKWISVHAWIISAYSLDLIQVKIFSPSVQGELWECPFCDPSRTVYKLNVPPEPETERMLLVKKLIRGHVELHRKDVLSKMMTEKEYEFVCE